MGKSDNKLRLGKVLHYFDKLTSTNDYANELLSTGSPEAGTTVITCEQTMGRGRRGRSWFTGVDKNLALSVILYPIFLKLNDQFYLNKLVSVAISDMVMELGIGNVSIKWPNDIYIGENKVAGILVQNNIQSNQIQSCIVGIGLNVNQVEFPDHLPNPTSLYLEKGQILDIKTILKRLLDVLSDNYAHLSAGGLTYLDALYLERLHRRLGFHCFRTSNGKEIEGRVDHVNIHGELVIVDQEGIKMKFSYNEIEFI